MVYVIFDFVLCKDGSLFVVYEFLVVDIDEDS